MTGWERLKQTKRDKMDQNSLDISFNSKLLFYLSKEKKKEKKGGGGKTRKREEDPLVQTIKAKIS